MSLIALPIIALSAWMVHKDPIRNKAEQYLFQSNQVTQNIGTVNNTSLIEATYVKPDTGYDGSHPPAYNLCRFKVSGSKATDIATVRVEKPGTKHEEYAVLFK